jgi:phage terminase small subunit
VQILINISLHSAYIKKERCIPLSELTPKQERFIQNIVSGMSQRQAYKESYNAENMTDESIDVEACKLFNSPNVSQRYQELISKLEDAAIMTAIEKRRMLKEMATDCNNSITDRIKAIDTDNKMAGEYITKVEADVNTDVSISIELSDDE